MSIYLKFDLRICWCLCLAVPSANLIGQKIDQNLVRGVVIIAAKDGPTGFRNSVGKILPEETVPLGAVLPEGSSAQTGKGGSIVLLLSNGTVMTLESNTMLKLNEFSQKSFDPAGRKLADLVAEPSKSNVKLNLEWGSIVVATKKLDRESSLTIQSQSGTAGIRGTQFQMSQNPRTGCKLDVTESTVNFTPKGGDQPIAISAGKGFDISTAGATKVRPVDPAAAQHIATTNAKALQSTGGVSLNSVNEAISDDDSEDSGRERDIENNSEEMETPAEELSAQKKLQGISIQGLDSNPSKTLDYIEFLLSTGKIDNKTFAKAIKEIIPNVEQAEAYVDELKANGKIPAAVIEEVFEEIANIEVPPAPPMVLPPGPPPTNPDDRFSYDTNTNTLSIYLSTSPPQNLKREAITEANLLGKNIDATTSKTIPYLVDAYELGNFSGSSHSSRFNEILLEAVKLANILLEPLDMTDQFNVADSENLFDKAKLQTILDDRNPYFLQLVKALANKEIGAFGDKNDGKVGDAIGKLIDSRFPNGGSGNEISSVLNKTIREIVFTNLSNGNLGGLIDLSDFENSSLFDINVDQVKGIVAQDINIGSASGSTSIDLTEQLKTSNTPTDPKSWKVFGIGAGKDIIVKGDVSFKNSNNRAPKTGKVLRPQVKDHALAIGALDEIHFHSKTIEKDWGLPADFLEKHLDYSGSTQTEDGDPAKFYDRRTDRIKMDFDGANLYLGSISKMELVNVDLESGGNLGVASLDELHIVSSDPTNTPNTFTVGNNTNPADRGDNVQLFANKRIVADGLQFDGRVDSIYMEASTVDLKNVTFPHGSEVNLATDLGGVDGKYPTFGIGKRQVGRVNFIDQVKYGTGTKQINSQTSFDALGKLTNGKPRITISKR